MENIIINHCLDYFKKKEIDKSIGNQELFKSYFQTIQNLFNNVVENDFARGTIISAFYSRIKSEKLIVSDFISNSEITSFFKDYNHFKNSFEIDHRENLLKIKKEFSSIINIDDIENQNEFISYCLTESMIEYENAEISFISAQDTINSNYSKQFSHTFSNKKNEIEIIEELKNKKFGFYLYNLPYKGLVNKEISSKGSVCIVSHQWNGITLFNLHSEIKSFQGLNGKIPQVENAVNKEHLINVIVDNKKSNSTEISLNLNNNDKKFESINFINKLIILGIINIATNEVERIKNENKPPLFISFNEKSNLPVIKDFNFIKSPVISFDELRFKGEYEFLSPLDDLFEDIIDMNTVNYFDDSSFLYHEITMNFEDSKDDLFNGYFKKTFIPNKFNKEQFNNFFIKKMNFNEGYLGIQRSKLLVTPLRNSLIGTKESIYKENFHIAKMNKLTLYVLYIEHFCNIYYEDFKMNMHKFLSENIDDIMQDEDFLSLIECVFTTKNLKSLFTKINAVNSVFINENDVGFAGSSDITKDSKIKFLMNIPLSNDKIYDHFVNKYNMSLSNESMFFIFYQKSTFKLKEMYNNLNIKNKKRQTFFGIMHNSIDLELLSWQDYYSNISLLIPLNKEKYKEINEKLNRKNIKINELNKNSADYTGQNFNDYKFNNLK